MNVSSLVDTLASPPSSYRPAPFFVLNDDHEGDAGEARITKMLEDYARIGFGGAFLHPRPGLITEYLSPRWFELIRHAVRECKRLGLVPYLYDENSYPSGVGGGHVPARVPEACSRFITPIFGEGPSGLPGAWLALYRWEENRPGALIERDDLKPGDHWMAIVLDTVNPMAWHGETTCPSLLHPRTAPAFLATTHEAYRRELGDLWSDLPAIFTDEPHLPAQGHGPWNLGLHMTPYVLGEFSQRYGYDLRDHLASIYFNTGDYRAIRYDLYDLMHRLWVENWARPLEAWCDQAGTNLTGHYLEHDWPCPYATPGHVHLLAHMHWPGTDLLETFLLEGHDFADVQNFYPAPDGQEPFGLYYLRQVHSVANQLGKERVLDEAWGAGGNDSTPADWSRIGRWLVVHGVNLLNPHLSFLSIRGTRKADHPQTFSDHSPWFEHLRGFSDELSRLAYASNQGAIKQRLLILDPLTTAYCLSRKADGMPADMAAGDVRSATTPPDGDEGARTLASVLPIQREMGELAQGLSDAQADFDIGDEYIIEEFGKVEDGALVIGQQVYRLLIWPGCLTNLRSETVPMLERFLETGGRIFGVKPAELTINGRSSDFLQSLDERFSDSCRWFADSGALTTALLAEVPPRLLVERLPKTGLAHLRRALPDGELFLLANSSAEAIDSPIRIETAAATLYEYDPISGATTTLPAKRDGAHLSAHLTMNGRAATILLATDATLVAGTQQVVQQWSEAVALEPVAIERAAPNVLVIDSCELTIGGQTFPREAVYAANKRLWETHGFTTNGWFAVIQYRDQITGMNPYMRPESGGSATYRFDIADGVDLTSIKLAVETPRLWNITVNGETVDFCAGEEWLDVNIRALPVGHLLKPGENQVTLNGHPFDTRREIDQIYLLGDFSITAANPGFSLVPAKPLVFGSWKDQGLPFFDREIAYRFELPGDRPGVLSLEPGDWAGAMVVIEQGSEIIHRLWEPPFELALDPASGREIAIRVVGLPKNLLGPFHAPGAPRKRAWTSMWYGPGVPEAPQPGDAYDLLDLGLYAPPKWRAFT